MSILYRQTEYYNPNHQGMSLPSSPVDHFPLLKNLIKLIVRAHENSVFRKAGHQNILIPSTTIVVSDMDHTITCLLPIGIGDSRTLVEQQTVRPGMPVIFGDECHQMGAACFHGNRAVFNKQQVSRVEPADKKPRCRMLYS